MLIKTERMRGHVFAVKSEANLTLFEYIDGFHSNRRIQERLGWLNPVECEEKRHPEQAASELIQVSSCAAGVRKHLRARG
ncbi:IS3 family transposase [Streptomyces sp. NPDC018000]|uniref:IS3 family transposase n=1 Tax=Streptomyces sp. NPDC018000 TaxID=3365028 RepID=UPI0037975AC1